MGLGGGLGGIIGGQVFGRASFGRGWRKGRSERTMGRGRVGGVCLHDVSSSDSWKSGGGVRSKAERLRRSEKW